MLVKLFLSAQGIWTFRIEPQTFMYLQICPEEHTTASYYRLKSLLGAQTARQENSAQAKHLIIATEETKSKRQSSEFCQQVLQGFACVRRALLLLLILFRDSLAFLIIVRDQAFSFGRQVLVLFQEWVY